jgi:NAD(P)-dependent dehydrogenase (short-subunit alcohol dehydrogenase family)
MTTPIHHDASVRADKHSKAAPLVVLTGSSRGIGRASALELGRVGARLALLGRDSAAQRETLRMLAASSADHRFYAVDLVDPDQIAAAARTLIELQGVPDGIVNNAAVIERVPIATMSQETWDRQQAVNLRAPFLLVQALLPAMLAAGRGRIVQVASIAATVGTKDASAYGASKWGLVGFTKCLAEELTDTGLSTVAILPGSVDTDMLVGSGFAARMTANDVAVTIAHYALFAPIAHNGASIEMFGV